MDAITAFAYSMNSGLLGSVSSFIDNDIAYAALLLFAVLLGERRPKKIAKIIVVIVLAAALSYALKSAFAVERPCVSLGLDYCPPNYSFPSLHAITAFVVMVSFLNKRSFWIYFMFAAFVSFTRLVLAVHSFRDIAAALALAFVLYHIVDIVWPKENSKNTAAGREWHNDKEDQRQFFHIIIALSAIAVLAIYGRGMLMGATFFILLLGLLFVNLACLGKTNPLADWFIRNFERPGVRFPGWGSACYAAGVLLLTVFLTDANLLMASLLILGFGDALSTLVGKRGRLALPYNKRKTLEGTAAFFLSSSLLSWFFIGPLAPVASALAAFAESLSLPVDDNILVPVVLIAFFSLV